jgi:hypothetical protein
VFGQFVHDSFVLFSVFRIYGAGIIAGNGVERNNVDKDCSRSVVRFLTRVVLASGALIQTLPIGVVVDEVSYLT